MKQFLVIDKKEIKVFDSLKDINEVQTVWVMGVNVDLKNSLVVSYEIRTKNWNREFVSHAEMTEFFMNNLRYL